MKEKELGLKAKEFTKDWLSKHQWVYVNTIPDKNDKYGRVLAKIYTDEEIARKTGNTNFNRNEAFAAAIKQLIQEQPDIYQAGWWDWVRK